MVPCHRRRHWPCEDHWDPPDGLRGSADGPGSADGRDIAGANSRARTGSHLHPDPAPYLTQHHNSHSHPASSRGKKKGLPSLPFSPFFVPQKTAAQRLASADVVVAHVVQALLILALHRFALAVDHRVRRHDHELPGVHAHHLTDWASKEVSQLETELETCQACISPAFGQLGDSAFVCSLRSTWGQRPKYYVEM